MSKQKIAILVVGSILRDPSVNNLIKQAVIKLHNNNVPIVICPPVDETITSQRHLENLKSDIDKLNNIAATYKNYFTHNSQLKKPFMTFENQLELRKKLSDMPFLSNMSLNEKLLIAKQIVEPLASVEADKERIALLKVIIKLDIPFKGITDEQIATTDNAKELDNQFNIMVHKFYNNVIPALNDSDGVIICDLGINYSPELAVRLAQFAKTYANADVSLKIFSTFIHSAYVSDQFPHSTYTGNGSLRHKNLLQELYNHNIAQDKQIYEQTPRCDIFVEENYDNGTFYSEKFTNTVGDIIEYVNDYN